MYSELISGLLLLFLSGVTSATVYGVGGGPGGAVGSPGPKRTVSGTGNTLKVTPDRPGGQTVRLKKLQDGGTCGRCVCCSAG